MEDPIDRRCQRSRAAPVAIEHYFLQQAGAIQQGNGAGKARCIEGEG
jgi:hypothetical protein